MKLDPVNQRDLKGSHKNAKDKDINNDGKVNSSDEYLHKRRQAVSKALGKLKEEVLDESRQLLATRKSAERAADQKVRVQKDNYNWGKMITVHDGIRKSFPLHPEHQEKIKNLKDGGSTTFTDETRRKVKAHREGDTVHLQHADSDKKTSVAHSHFTEEVDLDEKKLTAKDVKNALASAKAKPKETVSLKKPPFKMDEEAVNQEHLNQAMGIINNRITKPGQPPKHPSYEKAPEDIKTAAMNLAKNLAKTKKEEVEALDEISSELAKKVAKARDSIGYAFRNKAGIMSGQASKNAMDNAHKNWNKADKTKAIIAKRTNEEFELDEAKKPKPGHNATVMSKNISKVLAAMKKEETASSKDIILAAMSSDETDDASIIAKHTKPLRMKLAHFRHEE